MFDILYRQSNVNKKQHIFFTFDILYRNSTFIFYLHTLESYLYRKNGYKDATFPVISVIILSTII